MLKQSKNIFFLGIKGVAMANLAVILKKMGKAVLGADVEEEFITDKLLKDNHIVWKTGLKQPGLLEGVDLVVYSAAHGGTNHPIVKEAMRKNIQVISQADLLGEIMTGFKTRIAVSGCHGKTTTSSLLVYALDRLKADPSYLVGVPFFSGYQGADFRSNQYFVVEADEYGVNPPIDKTPKFFRLKPDWIIGTNIDFDHPDVYKNIEGTKAAFAKFFAGKKIVVDVDDQNTAQVVGKLERKNCLTYGFSKNADYQITDWQTDGHGSSFNVKNVGRFEISLFGKHNVANATAVVVLLLQLGFKAESVRKALVGFHGAKRRFELVCQKGDSFLFDDYAHHPSEIKATIQAARNRFPGKRIIVIFQPHTFSRTNFLLKEFRESLSLADSAFILPIFASARENSKQFKIDSDSITEGKENLRSIKSEKGLIDVLEKTLTSSDIVFTMGAGDVYKLKTQIIELISQKSKVKSQSYDSKLKIERSKDISHYLTLRNHVEAEYFVEAKTKEDLIDAKKYSLVNKIPLFILGGGSNLAITKEQICGLVVKNNYVNLSTIKESDDGVAVSVSSGYPVSLLIAKSIQNGWSGFEYHQGLPGTVGGAVYMNSKWTKPLTYFGDNLLYAYLIDGQGKVKKADRKYFKFGYDYSILQKTNEVILEAIFELKKTDEKTVRDRAKFALDYRKKTQPFGIASSGCFFRNPGKVSAGYLIDQAGLKGYAVGDYFVSPIHANFIVNKGKGNREDLLKLLQIIKTRVKEKFDVNLEEEVIII